MKTAFTIIGLLIVLGGLYVASTGPVWKLVHGGHLPKSAMNIYLPLAGLENHCPGDLLWRYENWWAPIIQINSITIAPAAP